MRTQVLAAGYAVALAGIVTAALSQQPGRAPARPRTGAAAAQQPAVPAAQPGNNRIVVYKSPTCGCCGKWVEYLRANGFTVEVHDQDDLTQLKRASGVSDAAASCHTAQIGGYVVEGHVPVETIRRMLRERPQIAGIAVPGMVAGTPGMEVGNQHNHYDVTAFTRDGRTSVYERH